jgi:drug/metabolite transporter (DMT)-like permease
VVLISLGIMALSLGAGASRAAVGYALATGASVSAYSLFSGLGVRTGGTVLGFQAWLEIVNGIAMVGFAVLTRREAAIDCARRHASTGLLAGLLSVLGFLAYLLAAERLPLGPVTALRETSAIFGAVIGTVALKEGFGRRRIAAAALVVMGIALLALWR